MRQKLHSLMDQVASEKHLHRSYRECARNARAPGSDGVTWYHYRQYLQASLTALAQKLHNETYRSSPYRLVRGKDGRGMWRDLYLPSVEDRVVQRTIHNCLAPFYETHVFTEHTFEYRPHRTPRMAMPLITHFFREGNYWVVEVDIKAFFASVSRDLLDRCLASSIADGKLLRLIQRCLGPCSQGLPIGNGLSPLLSNIYLHEIDFQLRLHTFHHVRFCDTFVLFAQSPSELQHTLTFLQEQLSLFRLRLNEEKTHWWYRPDIEALIHT